MIENLPLIENKYHKFKFNDKFDGNPINHEIWISKFVTNVNQYMLTSD